MDIILITGMSGSGKSVALHALEDAGYYCVDNLPPELLIPFVKLEEQHQEALTTLTYWELNNFFFFGFCGRKPGHRGAFKDNFYLLIQRCQRDLKKRSNNSAKT